MVNLLVLGKKIPLNISRITGTLLTTITALNPPQTGSAWNGRLENYNLTLTGIGSANQLQISTDGGDVAIDLTSVMLNCAQPFPPVEKGPPPLLNCTLDFWPKNADSCGRWRTTGRLVEFETLVQGVPAGGTVNFKWKIIPATAAKLAGATPMSPISDHASSCFVQLPATPVAFVVRLAITVDAHDGFNKPQEIIQDYDVEVIIPAAAGLCETIGRFRLIPQPAVIGDPAFKKQGSAPVQLSREKLVELRGIAQNHLNSSAALLGAVERSLQSLGKGAGG